ncbi:hypothetical protein CAP36_06870 [Chitinophagaceae bacterium IBVUCB2]|nr:hypothetical protein CAP36_06870 [Chitinophagaceae bacterium IBVUCB2]
MSINRHNYEEYFILYMDNELGSDDRRMVEAFIAQHPDLKEELELLQQFKLEPDAAVTYSGKEELMKMNGSGPVTLTNYDEWLVLYIDNELTAEQRNNVEKFLTENPALTAELSLYKRSKLQPETIVFDDKRSLYRKEEEKVRRLAPLWWRVAAAVLLVIIGTTVVLVNNKSKNNGDDIATTTPGSGKTTTPVQSLPEQTATENPVAIIEEKNIVVPANTTTKSDAGKQANNAVAVKNNNSVPKNKIQDNLVTPLKKEETAIAVTGNKDNNLPKPLNNPYINNNTSEKAIASVDVPAKNTQRNDVLTKTDVTTTKLQPSNDIVAASFTNTNEQLEEPDGKKNKLRGFFRKVTRTFEKRTNMDATDDDGKLLVAGLAIKLK